ncbi:MAG: helix-turn-helix domain-containing protein [Terriglobales bacterium]
MSYGIESPLTQLPAECVTSDVVASRCNVPVQQIEEYVREGLLIPLKSDRGVQYYTDLDYRWINTLKRLREESRLSFDGIRELLLARCGCWKFRHCEFHNTRECPMTRDSSKPCWANRSMWHVLVSYPCYSCLVYRTLPYCAGIGAVLHGAARGAKAG